MMKAVKPMHWRIPAFNSSLSEVWLDSLNHEKVYSYWYLRWTLPEGLMVPVVRDVDKKGIMEIAKRANGDQCQSKRW